MILPVEPLPVAQTFTFADENGYSLESLTRLDTMVTVVDASNFLTQFHDADTLAEQDLAIGEEDERTISDLLIDQVEFANVIVINKIDLAAAMGVSVDELTQDVHKLKPDITVIPTSCKTGDGLNDVTAALLAV